MPTYTLTLPLPPRPLHPNARPHYMARARAAKRYREIAYLTALAAFGRRRPARPWTAARIDLRFVHPTRRRRDRDNYIAALKPAFDGLQDAGLIADDAGLRYGTVTFDHDPADRAGRVELTITPLDQDHHQP